MKNTITETIVEKFYDLWDLLVSLRITRATPRTNVAQEPPLFGVANLPPAVKGRVIRARYDLHAITKLAIQDLVARRGREVAEDEDCTTNDLVGTSTIIGTGDDVILTVELGRRSSNPELASEIPPPIADEDS